MERSNSRKFLENVNSNDSSMDAGNKAAEVLYFRYAPAANGYPANTGILYNQAKGPAKKYPMYPATNVPYFPEDPAILGYTSLCANEADWLPFPLPYWLKNQFYPEQCQKFNRYPMFNPYGWKPSEQRFSESPYTEFPKFNGAKVCKKDRPSCLRTSYKSDETDDNVLYKGYGHVLRFSKESYSWEWLNRGHLKILQKESDRRSIRLLMYSKTSRAPVLNQSIYSQSDFKFDEIERFTISWMHKVFCNERLEQNKYGLRFRNYNRSEKFLLAVRSIKTQILNSIDGEMMYNEEIPLLKDVHKVLKENNKEIPTDVSANYLKRGVYSLENETQSNLSTLDCFDENSLHNTEEGDGSVDLNKSKQREAGEEDDDFGSVGRAVSTQTSSISNQSSTSQVVMNSFKCPSTSGSCFNFNNSDMVVPMAENRYDNSNVSSPDHESLPFLEDISIQSPQCSETGYPASWHRCSFTEFDPDAKFHSSGNYEDVSLSFANSSFFVNESVDNFNGYMDSQPGSFVVPSSAEKQNRSEKAKHDIIEKLTYRDEYSKDPNVFNAPRKESPGYPNSKSLSNIIANFNKDNKESFFLVSKAYDGEQELLRKERQGGDNSENHHNNIKETEVFKFFENIDKQKLGNHDETVKHYNITSDACEKPQFKSKLNISGEVLKKRSRKNCDTQTIQSFTNNGVDASSIEALDDEVDSKKMMQAFKNFSFNEPKMKKSDDQKQDCLNEIQKGEIHSTLTKFQVNKSQENLNHFENTDKMFLNIVQNNKELEMDDVCKKENHFIKNVNSDLLKIETNDLKESAARSNIFRLKKPVQIENSWEKNFQNDGQRGANKNENSFSNRTKHGEKTKSYDLKQTLDLNEGNELNFVIKIKGRASTSLCFREEGNQANEILTSRSHGASPIGSNTSLSKFLDPEENYENNKVFLMSSTFKISVGPEKSNRSGKKTSNNEELKKNLQSFKQNQNKKPKETIVPTGSRKVADPLNKTLKGGEKQDPPTVSTAGQKKPVVLDEGKMKKPSYIQETKNRLKLFKIFSNNKFNAKSPTPPPKSGVNVSVSESNVKTLMEPKNTRTSSKSVKEPFSDIEKKTKASSSNLLAKEKASSSDIVCKDKQKLFPSLMGKAKAKFCSSKSSVVTKSSDSTIENDSSTSVSPSSSKNIKAPASCTSRSRYATEATRNAKPPAKKVGGGSAAAL